MCLDCPNTLAGAKYEGPTASGTPFVVLTWQDCCAACQLNANCAAWVHQTPTAAGAAQICLLRTSVTRLNYTDPEGYRAITGVVPARTATLPPPPPPPPLLSANVPPPPPQLPRCVVDVSASVDSKGIHGIRPLTGLQCIRLHLTAIQSFSKVCDAYKRMFGITQLFSTSTIRHMLLRITRVEDHPVLLLAFLQKSK
jgi:hypothetical protein